MSTLPEAREQAGLTQEALANKLGWRRSTIGNYETGARVPSVRKARAIEEALGLAPGSLEFPDPKEASA